MYKVRMLTQSLVALYIFFAVGATFGYFSEPSAAFGVVAAASMLWLASCRTTWLPFLGPTVMPIGVLDVKKPKGADLKFSLAAPPGAVKCVYWASVMNAQDPYKAYGGYLNSGVADVTADGRAVIEVKTPKPYTVFGSKKQPHVHYRWVGPRGMLSGVRTVEI